MLATLFPPAAAAQFIERVLAPGEVIEGHAKYEQDCAKCHKHFDKPAQSGLCRDCHKEIAEDVRGGKRFHGRLEDKPCNACHTEHRGRRARIAEFDKRSFDHDKTAFPLVKTHKEKGARCDACHKPELKYREAPRLCIECHRKQDDDKGHKGVFGTKCETCHDESRFKDGKFDHEKTKFKLAGGKHEEAKCNACHEVALEKTPLTCIGCHKKQDQEKGHKGRYGEKCESCHSNRGWKEVDFKHDTDTQYALKGKHRQAKCNACHLAEYGPIYKSSIPTRCFACHRKDDQDKGHRGGLGEKCDSCHDERSWKEPRFDHDDTEFPLRDKHKEAKCEDCHKGGVSGPKATLKAERECAACHKKQDKEKGHKGRYGVKCETCHTTRDWKKSIFNHDKDTKYLLKGKHIETKCDACHLPEKGEIYKVKLDTACIACHRKEDKHKEQLGDKCENCHDEKQWKGVEFDHNKSRYPLTGSHAKVECKKCHETPAFKDAPSTCIACHEKDDKHKRAFGRKCESCHYTGSWKSWDFDHAKTKFRLEGRHRDAQCEACHKIGEALAEGKRGRSCITCHVDDDVHDGGFGRWCDQCHSSKGWKKLRH